MEILAPGGDVDSIKAAILAGADAVYCGLDRFNARNRASNIGFNNLPGILRLAHENNCQVFLTLNVIIVDSEIPALINLLNRLINTGIDGVIVQDFGLFYLLFRYFKGLKIHASTQLTTHNEGQVRFLCHLNATRVNLSRELNIQEIQTITTVAHQNNILTEVFVHGSNCLSFSGICYMSSVLSGNSGNRGRCSQPCRDQYEKTPEGKDFPLNLKDNSAWYNLKELYDSGVDSLKIEGRIKKFHYVYTVVDAWKKQVRSLYDQVELSRDNSSLYKVFNRDFSNAFLKGDIHKEMFIDNPRDHSAIYLAKLNGSPTDENIEQAKGDVYDERTGIINSVKNRIERLSIAKVPLIISISGKCGNPLQVSVKTSVQSFVLHSNINLAATGNEVLNYETVFNRLKAVNDSEYYLEKLTLDDLQPGVYLPFKELTSVKKRLLYLLNNSRDNIDPIIVPVIRRSDQVIVKPTLSVLISSLADLHLCAETSSEFYFQLPDCLRNKCREYVDLFQNNRNLIPWFPSVLIGSDYSAAVEFLQQVQPKCIVTDNSGVAYQAYKMGIDWIAGSYLNLFNSFSLICLKENFNCSGAFISNEISQTQIRNIKPPEDFKLYYSIYHPILLMTSRQCLFHQVTGCKKDRIDDTCIDGCEKSATITNLNKEMFFLDKKKGNYHRIYSETNFLNTDIVIDLPDRFASFFIDLRDIQTNTHSEIDKSGIIKHFVDLLNGNHNSGKELSQIFSSSTQNQYKKGI